ncbi:MAG: FMN-dependent NADH-azoreductase [Candidatus Endobugula sp.]|jgi:FMN-dependent NADH-azoreductase
MSNIVLKIDSSARLQGSLSRQVTQYIAQQLMADNVIHRDVGKTNPELITEAHIGAYFTKAGDRTDEQKQLLSQSDELIKELHAASQLIIGAPMYNFSVPAALKAWIDLVCRVGETFVYGDSGPEGLVGIDRAFIVVTAGGTPLGSEVDFSSAYLQQICRFIGIRHIHIIDVSGSKRDPSTLIDFAKKQVDDILLTSSSEQ